MGFGIRETVNFVLNSNHFLTYFKLFFTFALLTFSGVSIFYSVFKTRNKLLLLGGGMIFGPLVFLFLLTVLSYIFKGGFWIFTIYLLQLLASLILFLKNKNQIRKYLVKTNITLGSILVILILAFYFLFIVFYAKSSALGGDVSTYWGIATSFARGNYPAVLPWQPNYLTIYHMGAFIVLGAIHSISGADIYLTHMFFSVFIIWAVFIFIVGLVREKTRNILGLLVPVFVLILFGGPVLYLDYFGPLKKILVDSVNIVLSARGEIPMFRDFRASIGSGANDLGALVYANFYTFALGTLLVTIYLLNSKLKIGLLKKYLLVTFLGFLTLSIDESVFLSEVPVIIIFFLLSTSKLPTTKKMHYIFIIILCSLVLFILIQNPVRDSLLMPAKIENRFEILSPNDYGFLDRVRFADSRLISIDSQNWLLPSLPLLIATVITISLLFKSVYGIEFSLIALISLVLSYFVVNTFWPANGLRFTNQSNQILMLAIGFLLVDLIRLVKTKKSVQYLLVIIFFLFIPQLVNDNFYFIKKAQNKNENHFIIGYGSVNPTLDWIANHISYNKKFLFIDTYPEKSNSSPLTLQAVTTYGLFAPTVPPEIKVLNFDFGGEWFDAVTFLDPVAINKLDISYLVVSQNSLVTASEKRKLLLTDSNYFKNIYSTMDADIYEIQPSFKKLSDDEISLEKIADMIPDNSRVYLDTLRLPEPRKGFLTFLSHRTHLVGPHYNQGWDQFMYIEDFFPLEVTEDKLKMLECEYIITNETNDLPKINKFTEIAKTYDIVLWYNSNYKIN